MTSMTQDAIERLRELVADAERAGFGKGANLSWTSAAPMTLGDLRTLLTALDGDEVVVRRGYDAAVAAVRSWAGRGLSLETDGKLTAVATDLENLREANLSAALKAIR